MDFHGRLVFEEVSVTPGLERWLPRMCKCLCVLKKMGGVVLWIILHILYQGQLGQWQAMELKAS